MPRKPKTSHCNIEDFLTEEQFKAIRLTAKGEASDYYQKIAIQAITENLGALKQPSFDENPYNTAFNEGRRWVARFIFEVVVADPLALANNQPTKKNK